MKNAIKFGFTGLFLLLTGFVFQSCDTAKNSTNQTENKELTSKLKGVWFLKSIEGTNVTDAFKGTIPSIIFDFDTHKVSGNGGCNQYNGEFTLSGNTYATPAPMISTMMACIKENQESKLLDLLSKKSTLLLNNYTLQFIQNDKVVLEFTPKAR
jgi:heat shock protein HslJ